MPGVPGLRVLEDALLPGVVDADDDQGLYVSALDQRLRRLVHAPFHAGDVRGRAVEYVLPVVQVEDGVARGAAVVTGREVDDYVAIFR
jgi:hypothetical protein